MVSKKHNSSHRRHIYRQEFASCLNQTGGISTTKETVQNDDSEAVLNSHDDELRGPAKQKREKEKTKEPQRRIAIKPLAFTT